MISDAEGRLEAILMRDLGASKVSFVRPEAAPAASENVLVVPLEDGPTVVATFNEPPADRDVRVRRMEMLVASFADLFRLPSHEPLRPKHAPPARSLAGELTALIGRAGALAAIVVDARSPVIWGSSEMEGPHDGEEETDGTKLYRKAARAGLHFETLISEPVLDTKETHEEDNGVSADREPHEDLTAEERAELWRRVLLVRNALSAVRALPHVANLHKGEHLYESVRAPEMNYVVRSFAMIYMLVVVFEKPFDEVRAYLTVVHALPTIERLVMALPPREPEPPVAGAGVMRAVKARRGLRRG
ncbi:MAG: hypothetical protein IPK82_14135 [Polyangiaceae bacterium]|nr:hypothetical protein [Polyangiaceae bacterium]